MARGSLRVSDPTAVERGDLGTELGTHNTRQIYMRRFIQNRRAAGTIVAAALILVAGWHTRLGAEDKKPSNPLEALPAAVVRALKPEIKETTDKVEKVAE